MIKHWLSLFLFGASAHAWTAQEQILSDMKRLEFTCSNQDINRLMVQGDRIQQIFGADGKFTVESDVDSGQIFIKPLDTVGQKPINLTIVTEGGVTQDLKLLPRSGDAETLILKSGVATKTSAPLQGSPVYSDELLSLIKAAVTNSLHGGYVPESSLPKAWDFTNVLKGEALRSWLGSYYQITIYHLTNTSSTRQYLDNKELMRPGDVALAVGCPYLDPGTATSLVVISMKGSQ